MIVLLYHIYAYLSRGVKKGALMVAGPQLQYFARPALVSQHDVLLHHIALKIG